MVRPLFLTYYNHGQTSSVQQKQGILLKKKEFEETSNVEKNELRTVEISVMC